MANSLGAYAFRNWIGERPLGRIQNRMEVLETPGVDGQVVRIQGTRSEVYTPESIVDVATITAARSLYANYCNLVGSTSQQVVWNSFDFDVENQRATVLKCELVRIKQRAVICGALNGGTVDLHVRWHLLFHVYTP